MKRIVTGCWVDETTTSSSDGLPPRGGGRSRPVHAFTILEVLVALFIFAAVLVSLYATWKLILQSNAAGLAIAANAQRSRMAIQTVEEAVGSAVLFNNNTNYAFIADTSGNFAAVSLVGHLSDSFPASGRFEGERIRRVTFMVENGPDGTPALMMRQNSMLAADTDTVESYPVLLAKDVSLFTMDFWDVRKNEFVAEWLNPRQLPPLVRISLGFGVRKRLRTEPDELVTRIVRIYGVGVDGALQGGAPTPVRSN